jgi:hypothetical protein
MEVGINFFPDVRPEHKPADVYFSECLDLVEQADILGYHHIRIVEHYCHHYGGYSPNPIVFLSAAAQRSRHLLLITGAVLPVFNHPLKLAGEIGMLDGISGGRLEVGFARAFLPHEFTRFGVPLDERQFAGCSKIPTSNSKGGSGGFRHRRRCPARPSSRARRSGSPPWPARRASSGPGSEATGSWPSRCWAAR